MEKEEKTLKNPFYFLTLFKIEGHSTWRQHVGKSESSFMKQMENSEGKPPVITEAKVIKIDRLTGEIV